MEFERGVSGYRRAQVRAFLERVAAEREELLKELQALRDELAEQQRRVEALESAEADLRQAVIAAERIGNQMKDNARREAELIVQGAEADRSAAEAELARVRTLRDDFREQFRGMLRAYLQSLEATAPGASSPPPAERAEGPDEALSEDDLHDEHG
jgi:cell division initiation protein